MGSRIRKARASAALVILFVVALIAAGYVGYLWGSS